VNESMLGDDQDDQDDQDDRDDRDDRQSGRGESEIILGRGRIF
jgi:hypothetical protein